MIETLICLIYTAYCVYRTAKTLKDPEKFTQDVKEQIAYFPEMEAFIKSKWLYIGMWIFISSIALYFGGIVGLPVAAAYGILVGVNYEIIKKM